MTGKNNSATAMQNNQVAISVNLALRSEMSFKSVQARYHCPRKTVVAFSLLLAKSSAYIFALAIVGRAAVMAGFFTKIATITDNTAQRSAGKVHHTRKVLDESIFDRIPMANNPVPPPR